VTHSRTPLPPVARRRGRPAGRTSGDGVIADREVLLAAAERVIREQGPGVSLDAIAAAAGVTKPTLYRGVGDRDALVRALAERLATRTAEELARTVAHAATPRDALRRLVRGYLEHAGADRHVYLFVTAGGVAEDRVRQSLLLADRAAAQFTHAIASFRNSANADPAVATVWSYSLVGALHFVTLWWLRDQPEDLETTSAHLADLLWGGLRVDAESGMEKRKSR
jgi:AcrR family transcriptional regulator